MEKVAIFFKKSIWGKSLVLLLVWNLAVRLVMVASYFTLSERFAPLDFLNKFWQSNFIFWSLANFDGEHYLSIAQFGYQIRAGFPQYAFFPLFPLLINLVAKLTRDVYLAGWLVSQLSLWVALTYIAKWCQLKKLPNLNAFLLISTGAVFLASIYTESLFLALAAMTMYYGETKSWFKASLFAALSTTARVNGIFLVAYLAIKYYQSKKSIIQSGLIALTSSLGLLSYMTYLYFKTGDFMSWFHSQAAWGKAVATSPVITLLSYFHAITGGFIPDLTHLVVIIEVSITVIAITLFVKLLSLSLLDLSYWIYLAGNLAMPIATGSLGSTPRFFLTLFPLLVVIPRLKRPVRLSYTIFSLVAGITGIILYTRGYWYG